MEPVNGTKPGISKGTVVEGAVTANFKGETQAVELHLDRFSY